MADSNLVYDTIHFLGRSLKRPCQKRLPDAAEPVVAGLLTKEGLDAATVHLRSAMGKDVLLIQTPHCASCSLVWSLTYCVAIPMIMHEITQRFGMAIS